jgi:hypothetical protein
MWWIYHVLVYENGKMRSVETILEMGEGEKRRMTEGVNLSIFVNVTMYPSTIIC